MQGSSPEKKGWGWGGGGGGRKCMCYARGTLGVSGDILSQENALRSLLVHSCSSSCHTPPPNCSIELLHEPLHGVDRAEMSREYEGLGGDSQTMSVLQHLFSRDLFQAKQQNKWWLNSSFRREKPGP